ncbi:MAG: hypothetical protein JXR37_17760 [Kiritimatiellae bacterium]|nr:hypothetical protein [Kiritimatiellia bacterium]
MTGTMPRWGIGPAAGLVCALLAAGVAGQPASPAPAAEPGTRVIADWDVVPHQLVDKPFNVGVVAFHETGAQVRFRVTAAGAAEPLLTRTVQAPTFNPQSGVWEFWFTLDPAGLPAGPVEVHAEAEPLGAGHITTKLGPLPLHVKPRSAGRTASDAAVWADAKGGDDASGDGTRSKPFKTLAAAARKTRDGGTVCLMPGHYSPHALGGGLNRTFWTVITPAPGVKPEEVWIGAGRPSTERLCFRQVTLFANPPDRKYNTILCGENGRTMVWCDACTFTNRKGRWEGGGNAFGNRYEAYITGGKTVDMDNGPGARLLRGHLIEKITSDALTSARTAINVVVRDISAGKTGAHPDWHQSHTGAADKYKTCIIYNCAGFDCDSQGFFGENLRDSAFVNCVFDKRAGGYLSQYSGGMDHVLWLHLTVPNQTWLWRDDLKARNCHVLNGLFTGMGRHNGGDTTGIRIAVNHFLNPKSGMGTETTTGAGAFADPETNDFRLRADCPAVGSGIPLQCVPADIAGNPYAANRPNRGCYAGSVPATTTPER